MLIFEEGDVDKDEGVEGSNAGSGRSMSRSRMSRAVVREQRIVDVDEGCTINHKSRA